MAGRQRRNLPVRQRRMVLPGRERELLPFPFDFSQAEPECDLIWVLLSGRIARSFRERRWRGGGGEKHGEDLEGDF